MVNSLVKLMHEKISENLDDICEVYVSCTECPYSMEHKSTIYLRDGSKFTTGCAKIVLTDVFKYHLVEEDIK